MTQRQNKLIKLQKGMEDIYPRESVSQREVRAHSFP